MRLRNRDVTQRYRNLTHCLAENGSARKHQHRAGRFLRTQKVRRQSADVAQCHRFQNLCAVNKILRIKVHVAVMKARLTPDAHTEVSAAQFRLHLFVEVEVLTATTAVLIEMLLAHNLLDFFSNLGRQFVIVLSGQAKFPGSRFRLRRPRPWRHKYRRPLIWPAAPSSGDWFAHGSRARLPHGPE